MLVEFSHPTSALSRITKLCLLCVYSKPQSFNFTYIFFKTFEAYCGFKM